jgi:uncharacterized ion transporter superfamily protein YfcC
MTESQGGLRIGRRAFLTSLGILLALMVLSGVLTRIVPAGTYSRQMVDGRLQIVPGSVYLRTLRPDYPVWRWFTAPMEVLWGPDSLVILSIIVLILLVCGSFAVLDSSGILKAMLAGMVRRFRGRKYALLAAVVLFFMLFGAVLGSFEEMIPLILVVVPLAHILGWDTLVGLGMSLLASAFGFAAAITNPFTLGVAQRLAGLPPFSGAWLRIPFFLLVYALVLGFLMRYARRVERNPQASLSHAEDRALKARYSQEALLGSGSDGADGPGGAAAQRATLWFAVWIALSLVFVAASTRIPALSFLSFPAIGAGFLVAGVGAGLLAGSPAGRIAAAFARGMAGILPGMLLLLLAMSIKHIVVNGGIMDTILAAAARGIASAPRIVAVLLIYLLVLVLEFFIGSATAKSFLLMPILTPLADLVGISRQIMVTAFTLGDGFSNVLYPTNPVLIIALGLTVVGYARWLRWTFKLQAAILAASLLLLLLALAVGYGP